MQTTALGVIGVFFLLKSINNKKNVREGTGSVLLKDKCETRYSNNLKVENNRIVVNKDVLPSNDNALSLGSTNRRFLDIFLGPGTVEFKNGMRSFLYKFSTSSNSSLHWRNEAYLLFGRRCSRICAKRCGVMVNPNNFVSIKQSLKKKDNKKWNIVTLLLGF
jgi:phosphotransferase system IIB component